RAVPPSGPVRNSRSSKGSATETTSYQRESVRRSLATPGLAGRWRSLLRFEKNSGRDSASGTRRGSQVSYSERDLGEIEHRVFPEDHRGGEASGSRGRRPRDQSKSRHSLFTPSISPACFHRRREVWILDRCLSRIEKVSILQ